MYDIRRAVLKALSNNEMVRTRVAGEWAGGGMGGSMMAFALHRVWRKEWNGMEWAIWKRGCGGGVQ